MYNYGSPRVGNAAFACAYNESVPNSWRITNKLDVIPRVPRLMGYSHIGNSCSVTPDGTFEVNGEAVLRAAKPGAWFYIMVLRNV